ncbi:protein ENDOSPERM DEFECTIVE 1 isoform X2 [Selaginella moellendorffii]|uniref:protein ENDOSPERM DEFECTIVE 1 isoform X2 n=1 Tax=Selaginella moellendorffii TaxID=88036 RepID=UPI000D1C212E|nr:protein ENDOSPERM DEFECTIVE 1 isoform X2 [Selaginella moellendorffii]|eukprot:XP_024542260.1 protein ENDOSPERM DEFECTIVE 1 isoform X2 [Selaginella moellendorffii]
MLQSTSKRQQDRALDNGRVPFAPSLEENTGSTQLRRSRVREVASRYKLASRKTSLSPVGTSSIDLGSLSSPSSSSSQQRASSRPDGLWPSLNKEESSKVDEKAVRSSRKNLEQAENEKPRDNLFEQSTTSTKAVFACNKPGAMPICKSVNLSSTKNKTSSRKSPAPSSSRTHAPAATKAYSNPKCMSMSVNGSLGSPQYVVQRWSESGGNFTTKKKPSHRKLLSSTITGNEVDENLHHHEPAASDSTPLTKTTPSCEEFPVRPRSPFRTPSPGTFPSPSRTLPSPPSSRPSSSHGSPVKRAAAEQDEAQLLKVLHNRHLQWRFVNARAHAALSSQEAAAKRLLFNAWARICDLRTVVAMDQIKLDKATESLKLASVLESHEKGLEEWSRLEDKLSSTLDEMVGALNADVLRVPLCRGAKGDALIIYGALQHASLILESVEASTYHLLPKAQEQSLLAQDLAQTVALEKASVRECKQLLERIASLEVCCFYLIASCWSSSFIDRGAKLAGARDPASAAKSVAPTV